MNITYGAAGLLGHRMSMEDEHLIVENFVINDRGTFNMYCVFDGHGGRNASLFCKKHMFEHVQKQLSDKNLSVGEALSCAFMSVDSDFMRISSGDPSGTTAVVMLININTAEVYVAHVGDSRVVVGEILEDGNVQGDYVTVDHNAYNVDERERVRAANGFIINNRVMGQLAVTRAIGDEQFKQKDMFVIATPDIHEHTIPNGKVQYLVLACDGLFDVMDCTQVVQFLHDSMSNGICVSDLATALANHAVDVLHSQDNVSAIVVRVACHQ